MIPDVNIHQIQGAAMASQRAQWGSRLGFILAAAGSAVGLGNIWKFPYITGENGGGLFVIIYLVCIALVGIPIMMAEIMIGRAAQGRPWIFREVAHFLATGERLPAPTVAEARDVLTEHLHDHYGLYGELSGVRSARKHIGWAVRGLPGGEAFRQQMNTLERSDEQVQALRDWFDDLGQTFERLPPAASAANDDEAQADEACAA